MRNIEELNPAIEFMKSLIKKDNKGDVSISMFIKTPNIYYKTQRVYIKLNDDQPQDITKILTEESSSKFNIRSIRNMMSVVYHYYFIDNNTMFNSPYYLLNITRTESLWSEPLQLGSSSPDPIDKEGTVIR